MLKRRIPRSSLIAVIVLTFLAQALGPIPTAQAEPIDSVEGEFNLPAPGILVRLSPPLDPPILKGIKVYPDNPFRFDFILDKGGAETENFASLRNESTKLIKYFLASLTIPEKDLWVNLSPYEKDRIVPNSFGLTEMGRDLLAEDYMLKQITASLIYPEDVIGKKFWKRIYEEAQKRFGTTDIPVNTFNKVWIVPEKAVVYENAKAGTAYVVESKLKVMLDEDYLSLSYHVKDSSAPFQNDVSALGSQIIREIVIPELTKEVNYGKNFAQLRQVYNSLILATWYKKKIKDSILEQVYADKKKIVGAGYDNKKENIDFIYKRYLQAFKKGVYNYIKEDYDSTIRETVPRKYFSGGTVLNLEGTFKTSESNAMITRIDAKDDVIIKLALHQVEIVRQAAVSTLSDFGLEEAQRFSKMQKLSTIEKEAAKLPHKYKGIIMGDRMRELERLPQRLEKLKTTGRDDRNWGMLTPAEVIWDKPIQRMLKLGYKFRPEMMNEKGFVYRNIQEGLMEGLISGVFSYQSGLSPHGDEGRSEQELGIFYLSHWLDEARNSFRNSFYHNSNSGILVIPSSFFNQELKAGRAAVHGMENTDYRFPFLTQSPKLHNVAYIIVNPQIKAYFDEVRQGLHPEAEKLKEALLVPRAPEIISLPEKVGRSGSTAHILKTIGINFGDNISVPTNIYPRNSAMNTTIQGTKFPSFQSAIARYPELEKKPLYNASLWNDPRFVGQIESKHPGFNSRSKEFSAKDNKEVITALRDFYQPLLDDDRMEYFPNSFDPDKFDDEHILTAFADDIANNMPWYMRSIERLYRPRIDAEHHLSKGDIRLFLALLNAVAVSWKASENASIQPVSPIKPERNILAELGITPGSVLNNALRPDQRPDLEQTLASKPELRPALKTEQKLVQLRLNFRTKKQGGIVTKGIVAEGIVKKLTGDLEGQQLKLAKRVLLILKSKLKNIDPKIKLHSIEGLYKTKPVKILPSESRQVSLNPRNAVEIRFSNGAEVTFHLIVKEQRSRGKVSWSRKILVSTGGWKNDSEVEDIIITNQLELGRAENKGDDSKNLAMNGGIDLTPSRMNVEVKNDIPDGIKFHLDAAMLQQLQNSLGFYPNVISIEPLNDLRKFLCC